MSLRRTASKRKAKKQPRKLLLKFRIIPKVRMPRSVALAKLLESIQTGYMPDDLEVAYMDYSHKVGKVLQAGSRLSGEDLDDFKNLTAIMMGAEEQDTIRFEKV